jgi:very-short-patch-repair endonuclease
MTPLEKFQNLKLDYKILSLSSQNHVRRKYVREYILTEELIRYCVEKLNYSAYHITKEIFFEKGYYVDAGTVIDFCKEKGIKTFSSKESANNPLVRNKYEKTCKIKYGEVNALSKNTCVYNKRNETVKSKYNVENVFQLDSVKEKSKTTMIEKYGVSSSIFLPTFERNYGRRSKIHLKIEKILKENGIEFESEVKNRFLAFNELRQSEYSPIVDILIEHKKVVIEINGNKWHANPKYYKSTDMIERWGGLISASDVWKLDNSRNNQIRNFGYEVIVLWEDEINKNLTLINEILYEKVFKN